jgi:hypothetical protein
MTTTWHVDDAALVRWVEGTDGSVAGASVEQHLLACPDCRARVVAPTPTVWERVRETVEAPRASVLELLLRRTGLAEADARIVAVSPAFRAAWLVGMVALLAFVTVAGAFGEGRGQWAFLVVAPLVPALAVALGYDPEVDEALEQECATPYSRLRLVLLRSAALILVAIPAFVTVSAVLPGSLAFWWLVPAAGCTAMVLALSTWVAPLTAAGVVAIGWAVLVTTVARDSTAATALGGGYVAAYALVGVAAVLLLVLRRGRLATGGIR